MYRHEPLPTCHEKNKICGNSIDYIVTSRAFFMSSRTTDGEKRAQLSRRLDTDFSRLRISSYTFLLLLHIYI